MESNKQVPEYVLIDVKFDKMKTIFRYKSFYKTHQEGELVVVKSPKDFVNRLGEYQVGRVVFVDEEIHEDIYNPADLIIQKVSFTGHNRYNNQVQKIMDSIINVDAEWDKLTEEQKKELLKLEEEEESVEVDS